MSEYLHGSFLASLPDHERSEFAKLGTVRCFTRDQHLTWIGESGRETFLIMSGCVKVFADSVEGRPILLALRMAGDLVGELSVLDGQPRSATAKAAEPVVARLIDGAELVDYLAAHPVVANAVRDTIAARLREAATHRIEVNNSAPVLRRLARALCILGDQYGVPAPDGVLIAAPLSQADMSSLIGTTEQSVRRALAALRADGLVRWDYRKTIITDPGGLRAVAGIKPQPVPGGRGAR
jgi:CRP/FNR family transcriptional regulator, cyclic AMP receptor protein